VSAPTSEAPPVVVGVPAIDASGLTKRFGEVTALDGVDLHVATGTLVGLVGPNGAGKTTLIRILTTLLAPDAGRARVMGCDVSTDRRALRATIGLAGQSAAVDELLTTRENLDLVARLYGLDRDARNRRVDEILHQLDLADVAERRSGELSGGLRRRLDLGATLVGRPAVLFLDEPTVGLDPRSRSELWDHIAALVAGGTTVVLTSQYLEEVDRLADQVVVLDHGRVIAVGAPAELKRRAGGDVLTVTVRGPGDVEPAVGVIGPLAGAAVHIDVDRHRLTVPMAHSSSALLTVSRALDKADVAVDDLAIRRPSLDDVFLAITGRVADAGRDGEQDDRAATDPPVRMAPPPADRRPAAPSRHRLVADVGAVTRREVLRMVRMPQLLAFMAVQPVLFVGGFAAVFGGAISESLGGGRYIDFLLPGSLVMAAVLAGSGTAIAVVEDRQRGVSDRFRTLPMARSAPLLGRSLADTGSRAIGTVAMVATGVAIGFRSPSGWSGLLVGLVLVLVFSYALVWVFIVLGQIVPDAETANAASFIPSLLVVFASPSIVPFETMPGWLQAVARHQPVTVVMDAVRTTMADGPTVAASVPALAWTSVLLVVFAPLAVRRYDRARG
jgi:ABC transporter DrrB family efflux protein